VSEPRPRILVVDDEEAILETMTFTFRDDYEVLTAASARQALELLEKKDPVAVLLTDQRMPDMSGVELVAEVNKCHPRTVRMILTGFSDIDAIVQAINDGHIYAYIAKPWEPDHLKQVMKRAVEHYRLTELNERLVDDVRRANVFLEAVMDQLDTGAIAIDSTGCVRSANRPLRNYLGLTGDPRGKPLEQVLTESGLEVVAAAASEIGGGPDVGYEDVEVRRGDRTARLRITTRVLRDEKGEPIGRVILTKEISHEPLQRRLNDLLSGLVETEGELRPALEAAREPLRQLADSARGSSIASMGMKELAERANRTLTAIEHWLVVDTALAGEGFPDAQLLRDRMRVASRRWPLDGEVPARVRALQQRVEDYYESGENSRQRSL
jgi:FixJ family two-component response regulator